MEKLIYSGILLFFLSINTNAGELPDSLKNVQADSLAEYNDLVNYFQDAEILCWRASYFCRTGNYLPALRDYDSAIERNWKYAPAYYYKALLLIDLKRFDEASECFKGVLTANYFLDQNILIETGKKLIFLGNKKLAMKAFRLAANN